MVLQTFLLLDLRFKGKGLGVVALIRIKSASKIYYIEILKILKSPKESPIPGGDGPQIPDPRLDFLTGDMPPSTR